MYISEVEFELLHKDDRADFYFEISNNITRRLSVIIESTEYDKSRKLYLINVLNDFQIKCLLWAQYYTSDKSQDTELDKLQNEELKNSVLSQIFRTSFYRESIQNFRIKNDYSDQAFCLLVNSLCSSNSELNSFLSWVFWRVGRKFCVYFEQINVDSMI